MSPFATIGALYRRQFRTFLDLHGIEYKEHKALVDSIFILDIDDTQTFQKVKKYIDQIKAR